MAIERQRPGGRSGGMGGVVGLLVGILVIVGLIIIGIIIWAALDDDEAEDVGVGVSVSDITDDPEQYYGTTATLIGEVNDIVSPMAFTIGGEDFLGGEELLVIGTDPFELPSGAEREDEAPVLADDLVQVTGTVREMIVVDIEDDFDIDLDDALFEDYESQPVVVADQVQLTPRLSGLPAGAITIDAITENEDFFDNKEVTLNGEVRELVGAQAFLMGGATEDDFINFEERLLVLTAPGVVPTEVIEGVPVDVTGVIRVIDEDDEEGQIEDEFGFDIDDGILDVWDDEPVLIATSIAAGAGEATIPLERIATDALAYLGTQVTTGGVVEDVIHPQVFVLGARDDEAIVDVEIYVVGSPDMMTEEVVDSAFVQVTGTPYLFDADFEEAESDDFPFLFEDDEAFGDLDDGDIIIVGDSMTVVR